MAKAKQRMPEIGRRVREVGFSACKAIDIQFDDSGITLVVQAEKLEDTDGRRVLLSFDNVRDFADLANAIMGVLSDQEDVRINVGAEKRPR